MWDSASPDKHNRLNTLLDYRDKQHRDKIASMTTNAKPIITVVCKDCGDTFQWRETSIVRTSTRRLYCDKCSSTAAKHRRSATKRKKKEES